MVVYFFLIIYIICRGMVLEELLKGNELEKFVLKIFIYLEIKCFFWLKFEI